MNFNSVLLCCFLNSWFPFFLGCLDVFHRATGIWAINTRRIFAPSNWTCLPRHDRAHRSTTPVGTHCKPHVRPGPCSGPSCSEGLRPPSCGQPCTGRIFCARKEEKRFFLQRQEAVQKAGIQQERMTNFGHLTHNTCVTVKALFL